MSKLFSPLILPNGSTLPNRIAKAAMEENMANISTSTPSNALLKLYSAWANGGAGLIITGNVMVDRRAMTGPGGVVLEDKTHLELFSAWSSIAKKGGAQIWMQINHPGRQMRKELGQRAYAPSAIPLEMGGLSTLFVKPIAMSKDMIKDVHDRFVTTAKLAEEAGFNGVEIHAAHGYLLSQFLSPLVNRRTDAWGGSLDNRARLLFSIIKSIRAAVKPAFVVAVKLNSADFQRGGFSSTDAIWVVKQLNILGVDMVELSGGSYESPAMAGNIRKGESTLKREAYFLSFAKEILAIATIPVMLTGGISRREVMEDVLAAGVDVVGLATALALVPDLPIRLKRGESLPPARLAPVNWRNMALASVASMGIIKWYLRKLSTGSKIRFQIWPIFALVQQLYLGWFQSRLYRKAMKTIIKNT